MITLNINEQENDINEKEPREKFDESYKGLFSKKSNFLHFLKKYIAEPWTENINPDDMERIPTTYITQEYRKKDSDLIYRLKMNGEDVYFYVLLEMQSKVDFTMPFRLLRYMVELLNDIFKNTDEKVRECKNFRLPAVVPIILYNGMDNWTAVRTYKEYTDNSLIFGENIINFKYLLFDLNRTDNETITSTKKVLDIVFALNKIPPDEDRYNETLKFLSETATRLNADEVTELLNWIKFVHFKGNTPTEFEEEFKQAVEKGDVAGMVHSIEIMRDKRDQRVRQEGWEKGKLEERQDIIEIAVEAKKNGMSFDDFIAKLSANPVKT